MGGIEAYRQYLIERNRQRQKQNQSQSQNQTDNQNGTGIARAYIRGDCAYINNRAYPYTLAVDITVSDGMYVYCELCNGQAVIVGA